MKIVLCKILIISTLLIYYKEKLNPKLTKIMFILIVESMQFLRIYFRLYQKIIVKKIINYELKYFILMPSFFKFIYNNI